MMMRINHILYIALFAILSFTSWSCGKDDEPATTIPSSAVYDFVTIVESSKSGSAFEFQKFEDSPVIKYSSTYDLASASTHVDVGDRVIICYQRLDGATYTSGKIKLYAYSTMMNTEQKVLIESAAENANWKSGNFHIESLWRTGQYINMQAYINVHKAQRPEKFILVADKATVNDEIPEMHLIYANHEGNDGHNPYDINASFDINEVWAKSSCKGVKICYPTKDGRQSTTFMK